ncbi:uncharacterized protein LOC116163161 [Photinus pyralis]|uniref:uncharacterized protein LOC116163161 n=1 Tax=Photinus pyralis TaxID=7054 RepID=UPI001266E647|nr:uncharacterized protein LOC116163161 [Photinus pyralis]
MLFYIISQNSLPNALQYFNERTSNPKRDQYSSELRRFPMTLQFYSSTAYNFVRSQFHNLLPAPSTIRKWLCTINANPGFNKDVLEAIKKASEKNNKPFVCNLIIDQISLKYGTTRKHGRRFGYVDVGVDPFTMKPIFEESIVQANHALVFMIVDLLGTFKATPGYFLIHTLTGVEHANLVMIMLQLLHEYGVNVHSITYDGDKVNEAMVVALGANISINSPKEKLYFSHPITSHPVWLFPDPCHMLKNVRNCLAKLGRLHDREGRLIDWTHILMLCKIQEDEGVFAANKLTARHIHIEENKMNVRLAAQVLISSSVKNKHSETEVPCEDDFQETGLFNFVFDVPLSFVQEVVRYVSGFIVKKFKESCSLNTCQECFSCIVGEPGSAALIDIKNRGFLSYPSEEMFQLCLRIEQIIRASSDFISRKMEDSENALDDAEPTTNHVDEYDNAEEEDDMEEDSEEEDDDG